MNFQEQAYETVIDNSMNPIHASNGDVVAEDESPMVAFLRAKKSGGVGMNSSSVPLVNKPEDVDPSMEPLPLDIDPMMNFHVLANQQGTGFGGEDDDAGSINPLDAFDLDPGDLQLSGDDAELVDMALRSPHDSYQNSVSTGFNDSAASGLSHESGGMNDRDEDLQKMTEQLRQETMETLNKSMSSLNDAFGRLTASMDRTNKTREMLKQFEEQQNPLEDLRNEAALTGIAPTPSITGVAIGGSRRRRGLSRSGSNNSISSLGSKGSRGSRGRKSRDKTPRKARRNVKTELRSDRSRSNSRSSLSRLPCDSSDDRSLSGMPDQIIVTRI